MVTKLEHPLDWGALANTTALTIEQALAIQRIPAPTFEEMERAHYVAKAFEEIGLRRVDLDDLHNAYGLLPGSRSCPFGILVTAHTDTVFDRQTPLTTVQLPGQIHAPGIGDNSVGVAALISLATVMQTQDFSSPCDIWFVATTREEGLGNVAGMRAAFQRLQPHVAAVINIEGLALGHIYNAGIAVRRLRIAVETAGGHSWLHYGQPSAIHSLVQLAARITALHPPQNPRTTYNIGMIEGGRSVNSIASNASLLLDLRSEENHALSALERQVRLIVSDFQRSGISVQLDVIGDRPSGSIPADHLLVRTAQNALAQVGIKGILESGSTDGNIPLAAGCPTVTVGVTRGGNAHRTDEFIETAPVRDGLQQLLILLLTAADSVASGELR